MKLYNKKGNLAVKTHIIWGLPGIINGVTTAMLGYITYYATNVVGLSVGLVGTLLLLSKLFDGVTDLIAGFLIDRTNTKFGKARPYDLAYPLFCITTALLFSAPVMGMKASAVYIFVMYTVAFSVWQTLFSCAGVVYLGRIVEDENERVKLSSSAGFMMMFFSVLVGAVIPQLIKAAGNSRLEWSKMTFMLMIPCAVLSTLRFIFIKENKKIVTENIGLKIGLKEGVSLLFKNKPLLIFAAAMLIVNIAEKSSQAGTYYFQYIVGDIGMNSFVSLAIIGVIFIFPFYPAISKKMGVMKFMKVFLLVAIVGKLLPMIAPTNVLILVLGAFLFNVGYMPLYMLSPNVILDCTDYAEWKYGGRGEGIYACVSGFTAKVGNGLASAIMGLVMSIGGFDSALAQQSAASLESIKAAYTYVPALILIAAPIILMGYKLDGKMPQIKQELSAKRQKASIEE